MEKGFGFMDFSNLETAWKCAQFIAKSGEFCPRDYRGDAVKVLCAIQYGLELGKGISPMQALWGVKVMNGVPTMPGELCLALCLASGQVENMKEFYNEDKTAATFVMKRKGFDEMSYTYTKEDAIRAGLWGKKIRTKDGRNLPSPWETNPDLMLMWRAKGIVMKARFSDILKGMVPSEVAEDYVDFNSDVIKQSFNKSQFLEVEDNSVVQGAQKNLIEGRPFYGLPIAEAKQIDEKNLADERHKLEHMLVSYMRHYNIGDETIEKWKQYFKVENLADLSDSDLQRLINKLESQASND